MKDMFDIIVPPIPDQAFYEQREIGEEVRQKLSAADEPFGCILRGPSRWDPARQPSYPLYCACKTNTEDNPDFVPYRHGTVVVTSVETGEILVRLMREEDGKTPLARPRAPRPERPGLPRAKTYSVNDLWRALVPEDFRGGSGSYQAFLHAGDFQSAPFHFQVAPREGHPVARPFEAVLKAKPLPGPSPFGIPGASFDPVPGMDIPQSPGVSLVAGQAVRKDGRLSVPVHGAFRFRGAWGADWERIPLHVLAAVRDERDLDVTTLWIPRDKCQFQDGEYSGYFRFDLAHLFLAPDGAVKAPPEAWISLVHRDWRGPIGKFGLASTP